jgi:hypothetical protein
VAVLDGSGRTNLALLPISSQPPSEGQRAVPVPPAERSRIGLNADKLAWIYVTEYNFDILENSFYLPRNRKSQRAISNALLKKVLVAFRPTLIGKSGRVSRQQ